MMTTGYTPTQSAVPTSPSMQPPTPRLDDDGEGYLDDGEEEEDEDDDHLSTPSAHHEILNESTVKSGYLAKRGEKRKTWKKRWFVLRSSKLSYYKNDKEYQLLRFIDISDIKTVASVELKKNENTFGIVTPKRTFYVKAISKFEMEAWIEALNNAKTQYAQRSTITQEMSTMEIAGGSQQPQRSGSQERSAQAPAARPISIHIPGKGSFTSPAQPRPIPGTNAFSPLTVTSESDAGAERYGLSYTSSTGQSMASSPGGRMDPSFQNYLLGGHSPGGHHSGSEASETGHPLRRGSQGFGSLPRQRSTSAGRKIPSSGTEPPPSPGPGNVLSSSDEDDWDEEEGADRAMPLPGQPDEATTPSAEAPSHGDFLRDPNKVITQGYLMKQSNRRKVWRKRWFVLTASKLMYTRSHMDAKAHRQVPIASILDAIEYSKAEMVQPSSPVASTPQTERAPMERRSSVVSPPKKRKENCFKVITPKRTYMLCAPTEEEEIKWLSAMKTLINRQRSAQATTPPPRGEGLPSITSALGGSGRTTVSS